MSTLPVILPCPRPILEPRRDKDTSSAPSSSKLIESLRRVNRRTAPDSSHGYNLCIVPAHDLGQADGAELEELSWSGNTVRWSRSGAIWKTFSYAQQHQDVTQALFAYFEQTDDSSDCQQPTASTSATRLHQLEQPATFGMYRPEPPPAWSDDPLPLPTHPTSQRPVAPARFERCLVVLLADLGFVYPPSGGSIPFQLPFRVHRAWTIKRGILLERAREGRELSEDTAAAASPTLYSLFDPSDEIKMVSSTSTLSSLLSEATPAFSAGFQQPIQDHGERLIHASDGHAGPEPIVVTANSTFGRISVWSYARVSPEVSRSTAGMDRQSPSKAKGKAKASTTIDLSPSMSRMDRTMSANGKRKRTSLHGPSSYAASNGDRDRSQRRVSLNNGTASVSFSLGDSADEVHLLEALEEKMGGGASSMKRAASAMSTGLSNSDRRTSVTRNELSITMDRMALGHGHGSTQGIPGDIDREATVPQSEGDRKQKESDLLMARVWEMDLSSGGPDVFLNAQAYMFNSRDNCASTLAVHLPTPATLLLLNVRRSQIGAIEVSPLCQVPALSATPCLLTRPRILDLLFLKPDGSLGVVTSGGHVADIPTPSLPAERKIQRLVSNSASSVLLELDNASRYSVAFANAPNGLALRCLEAFSAVLPHADFLEIHDAFFRARGVRHTICDFDILAGVLKEAFSAVEPEPASPDPVWAAFQEATALADLNDPLVSMLRAGADGPAEDRVKQSTLTAQPLTRQLKAMLSALHLIAQDLKLSTTSVEDFVRLSHAVRNLAASLGLTAWVDAYDRQAGGSSDSVLMPAPTLPSTFWKSPPDILKALQIVLSGGNRPAQFALENLATVPDFAPAHFYGDTAPLKLSSQLFDLFEIMGSPSATSTTTMRCQSAVLKMDAFGWTAQDIDLLPFGLALPLREAIRVCQFEAPENWPPTAYELIRRPDLTKQLDGSKSTDSRQRMSASPSDVVSMEEIIKQVISGSVTGLKPKADPAAVDSTVAPAAVRFNEDRRLEEVQRMLQYEQPVTLGSDRTLDQLTPTVQQTILMALSSRTLALPVGHALFKFRTAARPRHGPIAIAPINTSARLLPMPTPVALIEKEVRDGVADRLEWPDFHAGVASALRLEDDSAEFHSSQIALNKPDELTSRHAGFLLGLGLTGRINGMAFNQAFEYLRMKHDPTSIGLLLGLAATYSGTGDPKVTSLISVHLAALHPPHSAPLNVSGMMQAAGLVAIGLLYLGSQRRTLADTMVRELCAVNITNIEDPSACREAYALSAGFAFGFIMLGSGTSASATPDEVTLLRTFRALILGENNHPLPGSTTSNNITDVNITSSAATIALSLMYLRTERQDIADLLEIPDTARRLDYVRSDLLLLRTVGKSLIMWNTVQCSKAWVESHVPKFISDAMANKPGTALEADLEIARWNVIAGACFGMGLKYAGAATAEAHGTLIHYLDRLTRAAYVKAPSVPGKIKRHAIRSCLNVVAIALAMVMAGTGELNVLRRLRVAHGHIGEGVNYGSHVASHMALGLLLVGSGRYTLGTSNSAVATLLLAFYPSFPATPTENRAHLQAYRHLWTLAAEPRCLEARDVDSGETAFLPIRLRLAEKGSTDFKAKQLVAPTLIPELHYINTIQVDSPRYWPFALHLATNPSHLRSILQGGTLFVKRRTGHMSYAQDPRGIRSIFTRSKSETGSSVIDFGETSRLLSPSAGGLRDFVGSFSSDIQAVAAVASLCRPSASTSSISDSTSAPPTAFEAFCASVLLECLTRDKQDTVSVYLAMYHAQLLLATSIGSPAAALALEQLLFVLDCHRSGGPFAALFGKSKAKGASATPSSTRESLLQSAFLDHVAKAVRATVEGSSPDAQLAHARDAYLAQSVWPAFEDQANFGRLAAWLKLHGAPDLVVLEKLRKLVVAAGQQARLTDMEPDQVRLTIELLLNRTKKMMLESAGNLAWSGEFSAVAAKAWLSSVVVEV